MNDIGKQDAASLKAENTRTRGFARCVSEHNIATFGSCLEFWIATEPSNPALERWYAKRANSARKTGKLSCVQTSATLVLLYEN